MWTLSFQFWDCLIFQIVFERKVGPTTFREDGSVMYSRAESAGVRWFCFVPRAVRDPGAVGCKRMESRLQHRKEAFLMEGLLERDLRHQCLRARGAVCYSSVTNGTVAGFCRLQVPDIASQDAVKSWRSGRPSR